MNVEANAIIFDTTPLPLRLRNGRKALCMASDGSLQLVSPDGTKTAVAGEVAESEAEGLELSFASTLSIDKDNVADYANKLIVHSYAGATLSFDADGMPLNTRLRYVLFDSAGTLNSGAGASTFNGTSSMTLEKGRIFELVVVAVDSVVVG